MALATAAATEGGTKPSTGRRCDCNGEIEGSLLPTGLAALRRRFLQGNGGMAATRACGETLGEPLGEAAGEPAREAPRRGDSLQAARGDARTEFALGDTRGEAFGVASREGASEARGVKVREAGRLTSDARGEAFGEAARDRDGGRGGEAQRLDDACEPPLRPAPAVSWLHKLCVDAIGDMGSEPTLEEQPRATRAMAPGCALSGEIAWPGLLQRPPTEDADCCLRKVAGESCR